MSAKRILVLLGCLILQACGSDNAAPCDVCTSSTTVEYDTCLMGACGSVCGTVDIATCLEQQPDMQGRILGCVDACDGCDTGLSCGTCEGPGCPPLGDAPAERCAAFNGTTTCGEGAVYHGSNG